MKCDLHLCPHCCCPAKPDKAIVWGQGESRCCLAEIKGGRHLCITKHCRMVNFNQHAKNKCSVEQKGTNLRYVRISMTSTKRGPNLSSCTPSLWEGLPEQLWSASLPRSLQLLNFALMFATGSGSWVPARLGDIWPQGAAPRGTGTSRAVHAPCLCLQHSKRALTCSKSRGCPGHCPPSAGPVGKERGAEAWYVSGGHHQFGSHHRKSLQWLSRGRWHLWAQNLPEPKNTAFDRDAGVSLIPGGAVGVALGTNSLPSLVLSIPSLDNSPTGIESEHLFLMIHL